MRKFTHKNSGILATEKEGFDFYSTVSGNIPSWAIENSNDWVEIKNKEILFTTVDGVDVKEGDIYYWVINSFHIREFVAEIGIGDKGENRWFAKKENAEQYVLENKPAVSLKDIKTILGITEETKPKPEITVLYEKFKKLAQERIMQLL